MITHLYQDHDGIIWISTEDGLNRYDGAKFSVIGKDRNKPTYLTNSFIRRTFEDNSGRFFVATLNGVQLYDRAKEEFTTIPLLLEEGGEINANTPSIVERRNGEIWIGTNGYGMFKLIEKEGGLFFMQDNSNGNSLFIDYLFEDSQERLWIISPSSISLLEKGQSIKQYLAGGMSEEFSSICEDAYGNLYVGSKYFGMFYFDEVKDDFISIPYPSKLVIRDLHLANQEEIYIATDGTGVKIYNIREKTIKESNFNVTTLEFSKAKVHTVLKDNRGNTWLGCYQKGVIIVPAITNGFNYIGYKSITSNSIGSSCVMAICRDHEGILWIGTDGDGLYATYPNGKMKAHYPNITGNESATIMSVYEDSKNQLWIGTYQKGVFKLNRATGQWESISVPDTTSQDKPRIYAFVEDANKQLWMGSMGAGLYKLDMQTNQIKCMPSYNGDIINNLKINAMHNTWVNCLLLSSNDKLYFGTYNGFGCMDLKTENFVSTYSSNQFMRGEVCFTMYEDQDGDIWIGTNSGLKRFSPKTQEITSYTTENGLPSNTIYAIKGDYDNNLWISTSYGLSRLHIASETFVNFYARDGLQGNEFTRGAYFQGERGEINFGGTGGVTFFNPKEIINPNKKPQIQLSDFYIHDKPVHKGMKSGNKEIITTDISNAKEFNLSHMDNSLTIEFSAMEFYNPERISYQYNFNNNGWISLRNGENHVSFSDLEPGKYRFQVRAKDYSSFSDIIELNIIISPPWYETWWAKTLYFLIFCGLFWFIIQQIRQRYHAKRQMMEHLHAEEINEAKLQFFINISHEIRTPMSLIISPLQRLIATDGDNERQQNYKLIYRNAERILQLINQLMDIRKIGKGQMQLRFKETDIVPFIKELYHNFEYQAKTKNITLGFTTAIEELKVWIDPKNFDKIIFNLLSNAFKYTPKEGHIQINLKTGHDSDAPSPALCDYVEIEVSDNGIGLQEEEINRIFDRFYQVRNGENSSSTGTGIGLNLTRSLVELHYGKITAKNNEGGVGSSFTIRIPLGKDHIPTKDIEATGSGSDVEVTPHTQVTNIEQEDLGNIRSKSKRRILIVEDDEEIRHYLHRELGNDFHIQECDNGKDGLAMILQKAPDLVISDVMMPDLDGMSLCKKIKQNVNINHVPIILLTAKVRDEDTIEGLIQGADAYITKPFNIEVLRQTAINLIKGREMLKNTFGGKQVQENKFNKIEKESPDERLLNRVMKVINTNLSNTDLNVEMIATEVGISRVHLHRKLKELTNQSTRDFIRNVRLKQAASLLAEKKHNVAEVAALTGFPSLAYFSTAFKDLFGVSPTAYMNQHLDEGAEGKGNTQQ
jgi:signal transduction histidine kinase/ligand-binding sensor domain-containing protein/DNA-binding response OmpR family regulator